MSQIEMFKLSSRHQDKISFLRAEVSTFHSLNKISMYYREMHFQS